jgi:hypothetical protein
MMSDKVFIKELADYNKQKMKKCCQDPLIANDINEDHSKIMRTLIIIYAYKITKLITVILFIAYFIGIVFYIFCDITNDDVDNIYAANTFGEHFIEHFSLHEMHPFNRILIVTYFAFTSLSTVGFGDLNPRSNYERIFIAAILLFGVAIFSFIMDIFKTTLKKMKKLDSDFDESEELAKFFTLIRKYN